MWQKKICMLGSFAVGKTSLVARFVQGSFADKYQTTIGVKVDRKSVDVDGTDIQLILWDIHGEDELQKIRRSYLRGASGYLLVLDGTRPETLATAEQLHAMAQEELGVVPFRVLLNKNDLADEWRLPGPRLGLLRQEGWVLRETSAKSGAFVDQTFSELARLIVDHEQLF